MSKIKTLGLVFILIAIIVGGYFAKIYWPSWLKDITYAHAQYFGFTPLLFVAVVGVVFLLFFKLRKRPQHARDSRQKTGGPDSIWILFSVLTGVMILALVGPKLDIFTMVQSQDNVNIVWGVDRSVSQAVTDVPPSRQELMIKEITTFVNSPAIRGGDRLTLFTFSEKSNWRMPLSDDRGEFLDKLHEVEQPKDRVYYDRSQLYTYFGRLLTHIPEALAMQAGFFQKGSGESVSWNNYPTVVFILSDGECIDDSLVTPLSYLAKQNIKVYTIGIGTLDGGSITVKVPKEEDPNKLEQIRVISKLNMRSLDIISEATGGKSYVVSGPSSQVQNFMAAAVSGARRPTLSLVKTGEAQNFWWNLLAFPAFVIVLLIVIKFVRS